MKIKISAKVYLPLAGQISLWLKNENENQNKSNEILLRIDNYTLRTFFPVTRAPLAPPLKLWRHAVDCAQGRLPS